MRLESEDHANSSTPCESPNLSQSQSVQSFYLTPHSNSSSCAGENCTDEEKRADQLLRNHSKPTLSRKRMSLMRREPSAFEGKLSMDYRRKSHLTQLREEISKVAPDGFINENKMDSLLSLTTFNNILFALFDSTSKGFLDQTEWIESLKSTTKILVHNLELAELIEAVAYVICGDKEIDIDSFHKIMSSRGLSRKLLNLTRRDGVDCCTISDIMETIIFITCRDRTGSCKDEEMISRIKNHFQKYLSNDKKYLTLGEFRKIIPCKDDFFCERIFSVFDGDSSGTVSLAEMLEHIINFNQQDSDAKIEFLFKVYDANNDQLLTEAEYREVIRACMRENQMEFNEEEISNLTNAIFQDGVSEGCSSMTLDDFRKQMLREEGLLSNLTSMFNKWLLPPAPAKQLSLMEKLRGKMKSRYITKDYWNNNLPLILCILTFLVANLVLFIHRGVYFRNFSNLDGSTPNPFYVVSRACGRVLLLNSVVILILVLRYTMTLLRKFGLASILPIDHNIYLHKMVGTVIFVQASVHSLMHLINFAVNIQPDPVRFVQLTGKYWRDYTPDPFVGYVAPPGCHVILSGENNTDPDLTCSPDSLDVPPDFPFKVNITHCQVCTNGTEWSYLDWMLTMKPGMLGMIGGCANPTGIALMTSLTIMFICSLPVVRRSGHFQVFYITHMLYFAYFVLLIFHAPEFWKWFLLPAVIWIVEGLYRFLSSFFGHGKTYISAGVLLPSKVTNLIIRRPEGFKFSPGDWIFIKIPAVAKSEWHPFTISSAPEVEGEFSLHIRGVGGWTNKLYQLFETEYARQNQGTARQTSAIDQLYGTMKRKFTKSVKAIVDRTRGEQDNTFLQIAKRNSINVEKQRERMNRRAEKLRRMSRDHLEDTDVLSQRSMRKVRYLSMKQKVIRYDKPEQIESREMDMEEGKLAKEVGRRTLLEKPLVVYVDGPFGSPSSNIYRAEHAVLIGTGIGVTPFASILQSIMHRYCSVKQTCPNCTYQWSDKLQTTMLNLKKVDFFWINRDQRSFEWFVNLLSQLEMEQAVHGGEINRFLDMHMYVTSALQRSDMKAVSLQLALDILHRKEERDLITGLRSRTNAGRPNWDKVFTKLLEEKRGEITVFYCGNPTLAKILRNKCEQFGFKFRKEVF